jgi:hypothetical protein
MDSSYVERRGYPLNKESSESTLKRRAENLACYQSGARVTKNGKETGQVFRGNDEAPQDTRYSMRHGKGEHRTVHLNVIRKDKLWSGVVDSIRHLSRGLISTVLLNTNPAYSFLIDLHLQSTSVWRHIQLLSRIADSVGNLAVKGNLEGYLLGAQNRPDRAPAIPQFGDLRRYRANIISLRSVGFGKFPAPPGGTGGRLNPRFGRRADMCQDLLLEM